MAQDEEDIVTRNFQRILADPELKTLSNKIRNCKLHELSGKLDNDQLAECKAMEDALWNEMEKQVAEKLDVKDEDTRKETLSVLGGFLTLSTQIQSATTKVLSQENLLIEMKKAGLEARRNPTNENLDKAEAAMKAIYDKAESYLTVPKSDQLREDLEEHLDQVMGKIIDTEFKKDQEKKKGSDQPSPDKPKEIEKERKPSTSSPVSMIALERTSQGNAIKLIGRLFCFF